ncbi:MAG: sarcosine oxidase subunit gamma [Flavobacteriaceae bacterium]
MADPRVSDLVWAEASPLAAARRHADPGARVFLAPAGAPAILQVVARRHLVREAAEALSGTLGLRVPMRPQMVAGRQASVLWSGPGQWLVLTAREGAAALALSLERALPDRGAVTDQSHGRMLIRLHGPDARRVLAKLSSLDYHDAAFPPWTTALTAMEHMAVQIWREADADEAPVYVIAVFPSLAASLWNALCEAALEFGLEAAPAAD